MGVFKPSSQMLLPVREIKDASFDNFYSDRNTRAKFLLSQALREQSETSVLLTGPEGSGKTHLLNAALVHLEGREGTDTITYFSLMDLSDYDISEAEIETLFSSFEEYKAIALDHVDTWLNGKCLNRNFKERCLFNLFNHYKMHGNLLLMASALSIEALDIQLPDLLSRLKSCLVISLSPYDDSDKELIMKSVAHEKGFVLDEGVSTYIMKRSSRGLGELIKAIDTLDKASLTEQRKLTIPFVKKVLNW